jgi:uncharacterized protein YoxC
MSMDDAKQVMWLGLALLFAAGGLGIAYALWRLGRLLGTVEGDLHRTVDEVIPIIGKTGVSVDTVNVQLQKVDQLLDSAVDVADSVDTTVRAVSMAVTEPVKKVAGAMAGAGEAVSSFRLRVAEDFAPAAAAEPEGD